MHNFRIYFNHLIISGLVLLFLSSCSSKKVENQEVDTTYQTCYKVPNSDKFESDWSKESKVVVHMLADPDNLHPTNGNSQTRVELFLYLHGALLRTDLRTGTIAPGICKSLPVVSPDQLSLTFELRDDVKWDDQSLVSVDDVIFTTKAAKCQLTDNPASKPYFDNVKEVIADPTNPRKFTVKMKKVYVQNLGLWCDYPIIQQKMFDPQNALTKISFDDLNSATSQLEKNPSVQKWAKFFNDPSLGMDPAKISGLGGYKISKWEAGQNLVLEKKQNHWTNNDTIYAEVSNIDQIIFKVNREAASQKIEFLSQQLDGSSYLGTRTLLEMQQDSSFNRNFNSKFIDTYGYTFLSLNMKPDGVKHLSILTDAEVRKAIAYSSQVDNMIKVVNKGVNKRVAGPVSPLKPSCNKAMPIIPFDINKAKQLLDKAGWKDTDANSVRDKIIDGKKVQLELELAYLSTQVDWKDMALILAEGMAQAGIKINPVAYDFPLWMEKASMRDYDIIMGSWNATCMPEDYSQLWSTASWTSGGPNYSGFGNAETDKLIDSISVEMDEVKRNEMEFRMQQKIYDEQPYVFMYGLVRRCAIHKRFDNAEFYSERPGILYNHLKLSSAGSKVSTEN